MSLSLLTIILVLVIFLVEAIANVPLDLMNVLRPPSWLNWLIILFLIAWFMGD
jgi:hypothetical protein